MAYTLEEQRDILIEAKWHMIEQFESNTNIGVKAFIEDDGGDFHQINDYVMNTSSKEDRLYWLDLSSSLEIILGKINEIDIQIAK